MFSLFKARPVTTAKTLALRHDHPDLPWPVIFKKLRRARNLTLRLDSKKQEIVLSMPMRVGKREATAFLESQRDWLDRQLTRAPQPYLLQIGETLPLLGRNRLIRHELGNGRGIHVTMTDDALVVTGNPDRVPRALYRFIKDLAEKHMTTLAVQKAAMVNKPINNLIFRDTSTRWGSCTSDGDLSFCWRLIMAPAEVVDYVVGHEVAHLVHMHHQPSFWQLCRELTPYTTIAKSWLKQHGETLRVVLPPKV